MCEVASVCALCVHVRLWFCSALPTLRSCAMVERTGAGGALGAAEGRGRDEEERADATDRRAIDAEETLREELCPPPAPPPAEAE